jgi:arylsulfatase A-like enzyme
LDLFPTLAELAQVSVPGGRDGESLVSQFADQPVPDVSPAVTTHNPGNHAVRSDRWRYIRYADGSEELYDHRADPNEWTNLAGKKEYDEVIRHHRPWIPVLEKSHVSGSAGRILSYDSKTGIATWEGKEIPAGNAIPE